MKQVLLLSFIAGLCLNAAQAADEDQFLGQIRASNEQTLGRGHSALFTLSLAATQYQPLQPSAAIKAALQAQAEDRFLEALILLDEVASQASADHQLALMRASFLLQGNQPLQALEILSPVLTQPAYAADAYALTAMAYLHLGKIEQALVAANHAHDQQGSVLPHLAKSYALQANGRLAEAHSVMHDFNTSMQKQATALAREAELELTLNHVESARALVAQANSLDTANPYVNAVSGLVFLIEGQAVEAKSAFAAALRRDPKDAKALLGLGLAEARLGNFEAGLAKLQAANEADPDNALILTYLGRSQQNLGQTEAARASWRSAQLADPKDPIPWLYQAQAELQTNRPLDARESLREAAARKTYRSVYRGDQLLGEDSQLLQANLSEVQRRLGLESIAFQTLSTAVVEKNSANLRNQADVLQGQRFGESARRSLLLQSLFNERPGNMPSSPDIYGDSLGQTGAVTPQHGVVSSLVAAQSSYNHYDALFSKNTMLEADANIGSKNTNGAQVRVGVGSDILGLSLAGLQFKSDGFAPYQNLDNRNTQAVVQWRPAQSTQLFVSYQTFSSRRGEITYPADPLNRGLAYQYEDTSDITRLGLRHSLSDSSELRGLISRQQTGQTENREWTADFLSPSDPIYTGPPGTNTSLNYNSSSSSSEELQYRSSGAGYTTQWGAHSTHATRVQQSSQTSMAFVAQQVYANWQQTLNPYWQLEAGLAWGKNDLLNVTNTGDYSVYQRNWLPKLGMLYTPDNATHLRLAVWKGLSDEAIGNASLAPASLAGIILERPGDTLQLVRAVALGANKQLAANWLLEGQAQRRWAESTINTGKVMRTMPKHIDESRLALHWQPNALNVTLAYDDELIQNSPLNPSPDSILRQHLRSEQVALRWFANSQWTANLAWSHNLLNATQPSSDSVNFTDILFDVPQWQSFNLADASVNWRFNRSDSLDVGVRNATNARVLYTEQDPLTPRFSQGRLTYAKAKFSW